VVATRMQIGEVIDLYFEDDAGVHGKGRVLAILRRYLSQADVRLSKLRVFHEELSANVACMEGLLAEARRG
jgi:hypothetical protein